MQFPRFHWPGTACLCFVVLLVLGVVAAASAAPSPAYGILVFSKTAVFRHSSIPNGIAALQQLGAENNFQVVATEDATVFNDASLAQYRAVVFLMTTGDVLDGTQQAAFERYIRAGNGFVGIHSASDTEYTWPWYGGLVGAYFSNHPVIQKATVRSENAVHPSTRFLAGAWVRTDEWYNFQTNPRANVQVLAVLDETTYSGGTMGDHPIAWCHDYDGGRAWYTAGGHTAASYAEPLFRAHLLGGIQYAAQSFAAPPEGAIVLFDGKDAAQWVRNTGGGAVAWGLNGGVLTMREDLGSIRTFETFDDVQLHLEFRFLSNSPPGTAEGNLANSGVYFQNQFEVQIMESFNRPIGGFNDGAAIYSLRDPSSNASLPGGTWETYDINFRAARWTDGVKQENARVTVHWNGVLVQDNAEITRPTESGGPPEQPPPGAIRLQELAGSVEFRNIWAIPLTQPRAPGPHSTTLVAAGSNWRYLDNGSEPGAAWRLPTFNDNGWSNGLAQFGYGDGDEVSLIRSNRTDGTRIATTYFRKPFVITNAWAVTNLTLGLLRDDGGIVYLNGTEIFRSNMTNAPVVYSTNWAVTAVAGADESTFFTTNVNPALLINGTNLLAVEIHQQSATSTDVSFDLRLTALTYDVPAVTVSAAGPPLQLNWPALPAGFVLESSGDLSPDAVWSGETLPVIVTNGFNQVSVETGSEARFYRVRRK
jgi:type 1 glutamine amidotransferase